MVIQFEALTCPFVRYSKYSLTRKRKNTLGKNDTELSRRIAIQLFLN